MRSSRPRRLDHGALPSTYRSSAPPPTGDRPHAVYLAIGFPPAAKSCAYRMSETANQLTAAGWDVTVVTIYQESWEREYGIDLTLLEPVDPRVRIVELPLAREELETDIRAFSYQRARDPGGWLDRYRASAMREFPEPAFGHWRQPLEQALLDIHAAWPIDLLVSTSAPYVNIAATWKLWQQHRVPYVIDFRDGWSVDVVNDGEAFTRDSVSGRWEQQIVDHAAAVWTVNDPIAEHYRKRYPHRADRIKVVRNGYDVASIPELVEPAPADRPLHFGYLGALNLSPALLESVLNGWRKARRDPLMAGATFEVRGHIGAGYARGDNAHMELLRAAEDVGVVVHGPVPKAQVAETYGRWDALIFVVTGGRYMTSGKIYEYVATGLPVVSAHAADHDASTILADYPLWTGSTDGETDRIAAALVEAARMARTVSSADRQKYRDDAARWERSALMAPAVQELVAQGIGRPVGAGQESVKP